MKKIVIFSKYSRLGASSRLRTHQFIPFLELNGYDVTVCSLFNDKYLESLYIKKKISKITILSLFFKRIITVLSISKSEVVWIEKELLPFCPSFFESLLKLRGIKYVVDYDDAIFHNYDLSGNSFIKVFLSCKIDKVMKNSNVVIVGNDYLKSRAKNANASSIFTIPTVVDVERYSLVKTITKKKLTIGWVGSPSTQKYVVDLYKSLLKLNLSVDFRLLLVGASPEVLNSLAGIDVELISWSEESEVESIQKMDIGIMPLVDGPWEKGKCGYKLIQYMACGLPVVASPVGVNVEIVNKHNCGKLASNPMEWEEALNGLLKNQSQRIKLGMNGRLAVENHYCIQKQSPILLNVFDELFRE